MPATLLTILLVAATIDPRLVESLRLLAEIHDRDGRVVGRFYVGVADALSLDLSVRRLPDGMDARYDRPQRRITIAEDVLSEDPRIVAVILAHELRHAADLEWVSQGAVALDCLDIEARGLEIEAIIARAFWSDVLPSSTDRERGGLVGLREGLKRNGVYEDDCAAWEP